MNFFDAANKYGAFFYEKPLPRIDYIDTPVYGFSKSFLEQVEADKLRFAELDKLRMLAGETP